MLIDMYSLAESVIACALIVWGLAIFVNPQIIPSFLDTFINVEKNQTLLYLSSGMFLTLGLITIWVHNDWYLGVSVIVTLIGWLLTIKSSLWLLFPSQLARLTKKLYPFVSQTWFRIMYATINLVLALVILSKNHIESL